MKNKRLFEIVVVVLVTCIAVLSFYLFWTLGKIHANKSVESVEESSVEEVQENVPEVSEPELIPDSVDTDDYKVKPDENGVYNYKEVNAEDEAEHGIDISKEATTEIPDGFYESSCYKTYSESEYFVTDTFDWIHVGAGYYEAHYLDDKYAIRIDYDSIEKEGTIGIMAYDLSETYAVFE